MVIRSTHVPLWRQVWRPGRHWWLAVAGIGLAIFWLSSMPASSIFSPGPPDGMLNAAFKKSAHMVMYGALATSIYRAFELRPGAVWWAFLITLAYGVSDEWHQSFVPAR